MTDLISRADAIECCQCHGSWDCINRIKALPSAEAETKCVAQIKVDTEEIVRRIKEEYDITDRWIPCGERLPDIKEHHVSGTCLVYCENGAYGFAELEENIFGQVGWNCEREDEYHEPLGEVIAWMPLPKPYREESEVEE